ncbi:putative carbohydrate binding domain containing protein [uncultured phage_MedDCM-OCT-S30-C28]|uniref:Putative carbohydrate binding domain containing protein n=1 Tax=uncultured phage_MedDCM-OCT-S30-C28 TaxID=2741076 RepID=A0A6S4PLV8_9CAUD|nr:putative carbohydrate binding domain containing protein [uncultured phage_MedDCM-OCT-S30-C28]BAQ94214.1 putative carbohydrate binding domain containing protein [uncultured phage_MedDCM-OCT-S30-C28]
MATLNLGRIKPVFRGAYAGGTAYVVDDIVTSGGETFICIQASTGNATSNATYWTKLAEKGLDGTNVATTLTTQGDILYRDGSGLQRLGAGTSGQYLETKGSGQNPVWSTVSTGAYTLAQISDGTSGMGSASTSSSNTSVRLGTNEITVTPSASTDMIELNAYLNIEGQLGTNYVGAGIQFKTSGSYSTATSASNYLISTGEHAEAIGNSSDDRYLSIAFNNTRSASDWGLTAGTTYYLSLHGMTHSISGNHSFGIVTTNGKNNKVFTLKRWTV